ncbi:acetyl-CoA carboxylase biotin carboxyl carrier protein subunit [Hydrogenibacillus schlegelii]|uniref:Acetyl-CoA carboxylase biotin carboxyl carrier protein subunit n=1 Tax=Hydrogenibacillus schlegelii TaxID=1484 RepID=A0A132MHD2_HYDSH|nr:acetyl-CoA carboxylase biotin carboxyl carrier protein subunit [Hydrogenibacillus schlegelii]KWW97203.1 acetyl-CoA carboxylase [Hydrogenibacillus schlegelii]MBE3563484.1 acetyl-CoA carboxylase biotin carboxyl carrier protein subunit [Hydrogenibacillus schlegelii]MBT9283051.1 acetyl-CoA carboxylase biotin carboxyl carrier protein subunit [Hydrogenibacillus schlegelii]OAR05373.1 biotin/lipoyl attachment protein [Hydrogenibacillus schlegelii]
MDVRAPMSGTVWKVLVRPGERVETGQEVVILESMKMEIPVAAEFAGTVEAIVKGEGEYVDEGEVLVRLAPAP